MFRAVICSALEEDVTFHYSPLRPRHLNEIFTCGMWLFKLALWGKNACLFCIDRPIMTGKPNQFCRNLSGETF